MLRFLTSLLVLTIILSGCSWHVQRQQSVLVIAVDSLAFDQASCATNATDNVSSGIDLLCKESVRFTHAYTPSVLAVPALATLLTARYPHEHGVWHNGPKFLSAKFKTVAEYAIEKGYYTSFFSGGPPVWSYSGLNQGFVWFSDHFNVTHNKLYRPAEELFGQFIDQVDKLGSDEPFFSMIYLADLHFKDVETVNALGETRSRNFQGQLSEVDESLYYLIQNLKKRNLWNSTHIVLVGVNGVANPQKPRELKGFNVFSSNSKVALLIKPAGKKRDLARQWKIDKNVSLVDVGATLFNLIGMDPPAVPGRKLNVVSLQSVLDEPTAKWPEQRMILTESAWAQWLGVGNSRFSIRSGHLLYVFDEQLKAFNTFVDQYEVSPISQSEMKGRDLSKKVLSYLVDQGFESWSRVSLDLLEKWRIGSELFSGSKVPPEVILALQGVHERRPWDEQISGWMARLAFNRKRWKDLRRLGNQTKNRDWSYIANRALERKLVSPQSGCLKVFHEMKNGMGRPSPKVCDDAVLGDLLVWLSQSEGRAKEVALAKFIRGYRYRYLDRLIFENNLRGQLLWNVDINLPEGPSLVELILALPEFESQSKRVQYILNRS